MSGDWSLFPHLVVRTTGFAWDTLERLSCPEAAEAVRSEADARRALEAHRRTAPRLKRPSKAVLAALRAGRRVPVETPEDAESFAEWNRLAGAAEAAEARLDAALADESRRADEALRALAADARFREAVASSSPPVFRDLQRERWGSRLERQLLSYVQRLCSKNETMSFFGPINYGCVEPEGTTGIELRWSGPRHLAARRTHAASWLVQGVARRVAFDPEIAPWLVLRRKGFAVPPMKVAPGDVMPELVRAADGFKTLSRLSETLNVPLPACIEAARLACEKGLLTHPLEIPVTLGAPLVELAERLAGVPGPAARRELQHLRELLAHLARYGAADAENKVRLNEELRATVEQRWQVSAPGSTPAPAQESRGEGHNFYTDRLPLREECGGDLRLVIGGERARELTRRLAPGLGLLRATACRTRDAARRDVARLVGARRVPFWKVVAAFSDRPVPYDGAVAEAVAAAIPDRTAVRVELSGLPVPAVAGSPPPVVASLDLLVGADSVEAWARGEYEVVVGDIHDTALVWGWALQFHESRAQVEAEMVQALGALARPLPVITVLPSRRTGLLPSEFPGPVVELGGVSGRPSPWRLTLDDLHVDSDGQEARLISDSLGSEVCLYNGELESLVHTAFGLPRLRPLGVDLGVHTPRLTVEGVVFQRERWRPEEAALEPLLSARDDRGRLRAARSLWDALGMPDLVFAKLQGERKPVLVDARSPGLLRVFLNLLAQRRGVTFSEMRPDPSRLWLRGDLGRHTSELRCTVFHGEVAR
ncbi:hypothetical protein P2318_28360 [Myxococcaceae bacterium GXIMD 01537]